MNNFYPYLKLHSKRLTLCFIFMSIYALVSTFSLSLLSPFLQAIFYHQTPISSNDLLSRLSQWFLIGSKAQAFIKLQIVLVSTFLIKGLFGYLHEYLGASIEERVMQKVRDATYSHLHCLSLDYFQHTKSGVVVSRITNDISLLKGAIKEGMLRFAEYFLLTLGYLIFALYLSWQLLLVTLTIFPILAWLITKLSKKLKQRSEQLQEDMGKLTSILNESIGSMKIIKAFWTQENEIHRFAKSTYNYFKSAMKLERIGLIGVPVSELIAAIGTCILISYGSYLIFVVHTLSADRFLVFLGCAISMMQSLKQLPKANVGIQKGIQAMVRVKRILDTHPTVRELAHPVPLNSFNQEIRFNNVHFGYDDSREVICGISLCIKKGETIALVGPSGAGKSTLTDLLSRFYDPTDGTIEIDGLDIKQVRIKDLRTLIGLVTQEPILFDDTIFNNIAYGSSYSPSDELVNRAAQLSNADEFIARLPQGYKTIIGERGSMLSGGERQRIAIARALYKNPEILIFDEATSHLDPEAQRKIQQAIENLLKDRTAIVIAHRLSTIRNCDRIIVMDNGKIVEEGTHNELVKNNGLYQRLVEQEFKVGI
ncbi:MAG: ABC transporter ATP-binding protein [Candidatus Stahlbacteria bacterium]|nr:ABC transporter ATP-binding protein [Candidatus Stahlbacteria bacterium]